MKIIADLHAHTLVSNHAFNTITEMARRAAELGHFALAITDHGPLMPDSPHPWYFYNVTTLPRKMEGVWVLTVSYTHLDVYKRQYRSRAAKTTFVVPEKGLQNFFG